MEVADFITHAGAVTTFAKVIVDVVKKSPIPSPSWTLPVLAIVIGIVVAFILLGATGNSYTLQSSMQQILIGILGGGGAIGVTELQRSAEESS